MSEQSLAASTSVAAPATKTRLHWRKILANADLPVEATALMTTVIKRARLWRSEAREVAIELVAHFQDGMAAGRAASELITTFGDPKQAARLIRRGKARCRPLWWQAWWWCSRGLLVLLAVYLLLVLWQLWAKPEVKVNYLEIINQPILAVPEADRAWPYYRDAYLQLGLHSLLKEPLNVGPKTLYHQKLRALSWRPGNTEWPTLVTWLEQHQSQLEKIRQGTNKLAYGFPVWSDQSRYSEQDRLAMDLAKDLGSPHNVNADVISGDWGFLTVVAQLELNRDLAYILSSDAIRAAQADDAATALADIEALLSLSRQTEETPFMLSGSVALLINSFALKTAKEIFFTNPQLWSSAQLQQLAHRLAGQQFHPETWLQKEQYFFLDLVQQIYSDDGQGDGRLTLSGMKKIQELMEFIDQKNALYGFATNGYTEKSVQILALPALNMFAASRKQLTDRYQQLLNQHLALLDQPYWQRKDHPDEIVYQKLQQDSIEKLRYLLISYLYPFGHNIRVGTAIHQGKKEGLLIGIALELYHRENGAWPETLEQLAPRYLPTLPVDHLTGKPLKYRLIDGKPCVYSVGENLQDDGGQLTKYDEEDYREGYYEDGLQGTSTKEVGDWILWSLVPEHQRSLPAESEKLED